MRKLRLSAAIVPPREVPMAAIVESRTTHYAALPRWSAAASGYALAAVLVAGATACAALLQQHAGLRDPSLVYLAAVLVAAATGGLGPSLAASVAGMLAYDYYFTEPFHSLTIEDPQDIFSVLVFLVVAVMTSQLLSSVRSQKLEATAREAKLVALYALTRTLAATVDASQIPSVIVRKVTEQFGASTVLQLSRDGKLASVASHPPGERLPDAEREAAALAWADGRTAWMAIQNSLGEPWVHISLGTIRGETAVLSLDFHEAPALDLEEAKLLDAFAQQAGVALERCVAAAAPK